MPDFNPPDSHWAADFDGRLLSSFYHLKDELIRAHEKIASLEKRIEEQDKQIAQGISDARVYWSGK